MKRLTQAFLFVVLLVSLVASVEAANIDVLWYTGGVESGSPDYKTEINKLIALAASAPISVNNTWTITYWDSGAMPVGSFDVLVVASQTGGWTSYPDYTALTTADPTLGDRIMVSGQDADWHFINSAGHQTTFDSSQGFLIDAVNWAGSGTGMGAVFVNSALTPSIPAGLGTRTTDHGDSVVIPALYSAFPINEGLTTAGLSSWGSSHHDVWTGWDSTAWTSINTTTDVTGGAVTLVSFLTAGGGTGGVPEPGTLVLVACGAAGLIFVRRRRSRASA